jgi:drug/metabolite transporter (DMT)-like permease
MWIFYAIAASLCWGMSYAACGPLLKRDVSPLVFFMGYCLFGLLGAILSLIASGKLSSLGKLQTFDRSDLLWFLFSVSVSALGAYLTYAAIGAKNPSLVALIEISYPIFVVLFSWIFFREMQMTPLTLCGGFLILAGVGLVVFAEH